MEYCVGINVYGLPGYCIEQSMQSSFIILDQGLYIVM